MENKQLTRNLCNMRKNLVADRVKEKEDIAYVEKGRALLSFRRQPLFRHFRPFLEENIFWPKTLLPPPPSPHSTYQRRGSWCQKTNHGANMVPTMVPTMVPWCQPIFSPYQIISGRKYFLVKKCPPSPPPFPLDIKTGVTRVMG